MFTVWMIVGLAGLGAIVAAVTSWRRHDPKTDLGSVSNQWVSERRLGQNQDTQR
jgi:uncharacterized iron-regulated membrane protein